MPRCSLTLSLRPRQVLGRCLVGNHCDRTVMLLLLAVALVIPAISLINPGGSLSSLPSSVLGASFHPPLQIFSFEMSLMDNEKTAHAIPFGALDMAIDVLTATAHELQVNLENRTTTS